MLLNEQDMVSLSSGFTKYTTESVFFFKASSVPPPELERWRIGARNSVGGMRGSGVGGGGGGGNGMRSERVDGGEPSGESRGAIADEDMNGFIMCFVGDSQSLPKHKRGF